MSGQCFGLDPHCSVLSQPISKRTVLHMAAGATPSILTALLNAHVDVNAKSTVAPLSSPVVEVLSLQSVFVERAMPTP